MLIDRAEMEMTVYPPHQSGSSETYKLCWEIWERRWSLCLGVIHLPVDLLQLCNNLCSLMDAIIPVIWSSKEPRERWKSQHGLDVCLIGVYLWSLSLLWSHTCGWVLLRWAEVCVCVCMCYHLPTFCLLSYILLMFYPLMCLFWSCWQPVGSPHPLVFAWPPFLFHLLSSLCPSQSRIQGLSICSSGPLVPVRLAQ